MVCCFPSADRWKVCESLTSVFLKPDRFLFEFYDSVAMLFKMESADSLDDSIQFAGFNLSNIEEQAVDYES